MQVFIKKSNYLALITLFALVVDPPVGGSLWGFALLLYDFLLITTLAIYNLFSIWGIGGFKLIGTGFCSMSMSNGVLVDIGVV